MLKFTTNDAEVMFPRESGLEIKRDPVCGIIPFSEGDDDERKKAVQP